MFEDNEETKKPGPPALDLRAVERAAARSRSGGVWSLGHLRVCWIALGAFGVVVISVAGAVCGAGAATGALIGALIVGLFFTASTVVIAKLGAKSLKLVMPAALATYVIKIVALGVVLTVMPRDGFVDTRWMAGTVGLGVFVWLGAHMRYIWTTKIFYVDPK
ncbi:hypothetical protein EH165_08405 [Nakamurella antarctica]|uniref:ATP synthase protein I n=1 Tax=Nakamurella antarctica TaxID=1902245 RepID=A0A3G8ZLF4_9ACTN|nr:hypothetical protein [Nakamurella antarctica]AZI58159.1 hypothetical protein EH165_08405 [Nakamurella antarctica]